MYFKILHKLHDLMKKDEALAKEYFYDVMTDPDTYDNVYQEDIARLFDEIVFTEDNIAFKMSVLADESIPRLMRTPTQYEIFVDLINSRGRYELIYGDDFVDLLYRYSETKDFIDDDYGETILRHHDYLHPQAIYYILSSPHMRYMKNEILEQLTRAYELDENTMYREGLAILRNPGFVKCSTNRQLEEFIHRISLNLNSKESKKFITEVMKIPEIREKYSAYGKLFNFKYMDGLKESHVYPLLAQKGYYNNLLDVTDKEAAVDLIGYYMERDPMFFEYFDYRLLNDLTMKLDKDLLFGLLKSDYRKKLAEIARSPRGEVFVKCANYLNERYPNENVAKLLEVLETRFVPGFVVKELEEVDVPMLTHFLLNNHSILIKSLKEYEYYIMRELDAKVKDPYASMSDFKNALCMNRYGFSFEKIKELYTTYGTFIESVDDEKVKKEFKEFRDIIFGKDKMVLYNKYMTNRFSFDKTNKYEEDLKRLYSKELSKSILSQKDLVVNDEMYHDGELVPIVRVTGEFRGLISAVGFVKALDVINDNYKDSIVNDTFHELHGLSTSMYTSDNPSRVTGQFVLGYSDFGVDTVQASATLDIFSESDKYRLFAEYSSVYVPPKEMGLYTRDDYNELLIERRVRDPNSPNYLANIYPSYVFLDNDGTNDVTKAIKASRELGIPLVYFDRAECIKENKRKYLELGKSYKGESAEEFIEFANVIFSVRNSGRRDDFSVFKELTKKLIKNVKNEEDLIKVEAFLQREINKGGNYDYAPIHECICTIRKAIAPKVELPVHSVNDKYSKEINARIQKLVNQGAISSMYDGRCIEDAYAMANACVYFYNKLGESAKEMKISEVIDAALLASCCMGEYKYDYRPPTNKQENVEETDLFQAHRWLMMKTFRLPCPSDYDLVNYKYRLGHHCLSDSNQLRKIINASMTLIEGEDLKEMATKLGIEVDELKKFRDELISVYNNGAKKVASNKK